MSKSLKILLALGTGVAIGATLAYVIKTANEKNIDSTYADDEVEPTKLDGIAKQFSDKISAELKAAETKIRSAVRKEIDGLNPERELGLFL
jgi:hypothetical protein